MPAASPAAEIATAAGRLLLELRNSGGEDLGRRADRAANELILSQLRRRFPTDSVLSEETPDDLSRLSAQRVWIVDPLDGTREFVEGRSDWAVHVALWQEGELTDAAVALPAEGVTYCSSAPPPLPRAPQGGPRVVVSRSRPPAEAALVATALGGTLLALGSAGAKTAAVLRGEAEVYLHSGGQHEWDSAAPVGVALAAGLHASRTDGSTLRYNKPVPTLDDLLVCLPELAGPVLEAVALASLHG